MNSEFNRDAAVFELRELQDHINSVIEEIEKGCYDDDSGNLSYPVALEHLMDHLVLAWHYSRMSHEEINSVSQDRFVRLTCAIPKFTPEEHRLVGLYEDV